MQGFFTTQLRIGPGAARVFLVQALLASVTVLADRGWSSNVHDHRAETKGRDTDIDLVETDQAVDTGSDATMRASTEEQECYQVWFRGIHTLMLTEAGIRLISEDPFLYAGHFGIAPVVGEEKSMCSVKGWSPKSTAKGIILLMLAKLGDKFRGQWLDDTKHFQRACKQGIKVLYEKVKCGTGSVPVVGAENGNPNLQYGFPPKNETEDPLWGQIKFNCITIAANMRLLDDQAGMLSHEDNPCIKSGQMSHCKKQGLNWCDVCPAEG